jgi:hypothetical protein
MAEAIKSKWTWKEEEGENEPENKCGDGKYFSTVDFSTRAITTT